MNLRPLGTKVIVKESELQTTTESGIIVASGIDKDTRTGIVLAVGPDCQEVKVNDVVYLDWRKCQTTAKDGDVLGVIEEKEIVAVVEE